MTVLVVGGAGYIGSHTCVELLEDGKNIVALDNYLNSKPEALNRVRRITGKDFPVYEADFMDVRALDKIFAENEIDAVVHFAGLKSVPESVRKPLTYYGQNVSGTLTLLEAMDKAGCKRIVFSSSATVYGANPDVPLKETHSATPASSPYGTTKQMQETILRDLCVSDKDWSAVLLRYFNPVGAHPSGVLGEDPNGVPGNIFPIIVRVVTGKIERLNVTGNDYDTPDGTGIRDYIHICDLAAGHVKAVDYAASNPGAEAVNLGTGRGYSVLEAIAAFEKASGVTIPRVFAPRRPGDIAVSYADPSKAKSLLGWEVKRGLSEMCADLWRFVSKNPDGLR